MGCKRWNGSRRPSLGVHGELLMLAICLSGRKADLVTAAQTPNVSLTNPSTNLPVPTTLYTLSLHSAPISSVRSRSLPLSSSTATSSPHLLTAGWDGIVGVWDLTPGVNEGEPEEDGSERKKKRRKQAPGTVIAKVRPCATLTFNSGHLRSAYRRRPSLFSVGTLARSPAPSSTALTPTRPTQRDGTTLFALGISPSVPRPPPRCV